MKHLLPLVLGAALLLVATVSPVGAQDDSISVTPAEGLLDGQTVEISATTTGSDYATLALCPAESAPAVGTNVTMLISTRNICVGLVCLHDGETFAGLAEQISGDCPVAVQPRPISSVSISVALPRVTNDGTDCGVESCVVVFNTWTAGSAQGAVSLAVSFDDSVPALTTVPAEATTTTSVVELSAPAVTSTVAIAVTTTTVPTQVLGTQENNDGDLAVTGFDPGVLAGIALALMVAGGGAVSRAHREPVSRRSR